jgi:hypothetical protein
MNKQASAFSGIILAVLIFVAGALVIPYYQDDVTTTRVSLDCTNTSISDGNKITCLVVDAQIPYFIWAFVSIAFGFIGGKLT